MFRKIIFVVSFFLTFLFVGCGGGGSESTPDNIVANGASAKGPFVKDSSVMAYKLRANGTRSGTASGTKTTSNLGAYSLNSISWSGPTEIVVSGKYFNENSGTSDQSATLSAVVDVVAGENIAVNINLFTDMESKRVKRLMLNGHSVLDAKSQARDMIVALFDLNIEDNVSLESLDLTVGDGDNRAANAELLRISAAVSANPDIIERLNQIIEDSNSSAEVLATDTFLELVRGIVAVDMDAVSARLEEALGVDDAPDSSDTNDSNYILNAHAPVISDIPTYTVAEDDEEFNISLAVTDEDNESELSFTSVGLSDDTVISVSLVESVLRVSPLANAHGEINVTVEASDGVYTDSHTFTIKVLAVNDLPILTALNDIVKDEDSMAFQVALNAIDIDSDSMLYSAISSNAARAVVSVSGSTLTISPQANAVGDTNISITVDDGDGGTDTKVFTLTLTATNDAPVLNSMLDVVKDEDSASFSAGYAMALDVDGDSVVYGVSSSDNAKATVNLELNNSILVVPQANANGSVDITVTANDGNGGVDTEVFTLTLNPVNDAPSVLSLNDEYRGYGAAEINITMQGSDIDGDTLSYTASSSNTSVATVSHTGAKLTITLKSVGSSTVSATVSDPSGESADRNMTITISQRDITIVADNRSKIYGDSDPALSYAITSGSLVSGDALSGTLERIAGEDVGVYAISIGSVADSNYYITFVANNFNVLKAPLHAVVDDTNKTYGEANPEFTATLSGFKNSDNASVVSSIDFNTTASDTSHAGVYSVDANSCVAINYKIGSSEHGELSISKLDIEITADDKTKVYGDADPSLSYSITTGALINGDTLSGSLSRTAGNSVGSYLINIGTLTNSDYNATLIEDNLTITKANLTATVADAEREYGEENPEFAVVFSGFKYSDTDSVVSEVNLSTTADINSSIGEYSIKLSGYTAQNYTVTSSVDGTLDIIQVQLTLSGDVFDRNESEDNPSFSATYTGFKNGDDESILDGALTFSTDANTSSTESVYTVLLSGISYTGTDYDFHILNGLIQVHPTIQAIVDTLDETYHSVSYGSSIAEVFSNSLFEDTNGTLHLAYINNYDLHYAYSTDSGQNWTTEMLGASQNGKIYNAVLAVDSNNTIYIGYTSNPTWTDYGSGRDTSNYSKYSMHVAIKESGEAWSFETVAGPTGNNKGHVSIGIYTDMNNTPYIVSFMNGWYQYGGQAYEFKRTGGAWSATNIVNFTDQPIDTGMSSNSVTLQHLDGNTTIIMTRYLRNPTRHILWHKTKTLDGAWGTLHQMNYDICGQFFDAYIDATGKIQLFYLKDETGGYFSIYHVDGLLENTPPVKITTIENPSHFWSLKVHYDISSQVQITLHGRDYTQYIVNYDNGVVSSVKTLKESTINPYSGKIRSKTIPSFNALVFSQKDGGASKTFGPNKIYFYRLNSQP